MKLFYRILVFACVSFTFKPALANTPKIDSLKNVLLTVADTTRVNVLNTIGFHLVFSAPESAEEYCNEAIRLANRLKYPKGHAHAYQVLGTLYDVQAEYDKAIDIYLTGLEIAEKAGIKSDRVIMPFYNGLGLAHYHKGNYVSALRYLLDALSLAEKKTESNKTTGNLLNNIGLVYQDLKEYDKALIYYFKSLKHGEDIANQSMVGRVANNIGTVYKDQGKLDKALEYMDLSLRRKELMKDSLGMSSAYANFGAIYKRLKNYPLALEYLDKSEEIKKRFNDRLGLVIVNDLRCEVLLLQGKLSVTEPLLRKNLKLVEQVGGENKALVYERFHDFYKAKGDYKQAFEWFLKKDAFEDSLFNQLKSRQLSEIQTAYDLAKREKRIAQLEIEKEEERLISKVAVGGAIFLMIVMAIVFYLIRGRMKQRHRLMSMELELQQKQIENATLREAELQHEIEFKNKELASYTINFVQKSELMEELKRNLQAIQPDSTETAKKIAGINRLVENSYQVDREWEDFKMQFENVHRNFFRLLKDRCPELTNGDLKLCALLKLNMNMKEAAKVLGISPESVKTARYRLRKKFGLQQDDNLVDFILNLETQFFERDQRISA